VPRIAEVAAGARVHRLFVIWNSGAQNQGVARIRRNSGPWVTTFGNGDWI
jgi:hypothetical protein